MRAIIAVSLLHTILAATISESNSYDTIVVGLGASGVAAASKLAEAGKRVLGLEAQDRIGGRVKTVPFGNGVVEVGAEWIHGIKGSVTYDLALKNNVSIQPQSLKHIVFRSDGSLLEEKLIADVTEFVMGTHDYPPPEPEPVGQFITRKLTEYLREKYPHVLEDKDLFDNLLIYLDLLIDTYESSNSWNDLTTANSYQQLEGNQDMSWHRNGYYTLFEILLNTYKNGPGYPTLEIKLSTEVVNIQWPQDPNEKVKVTTKDGAVYTADNVIVTMSVGVLKERYNGLFTSPLPEIKQTAVENISIGKIGKIILCFNPIFWDKDITYIGFFWRSKDRLEAERQDPWTISILGFSVSMGATNCITFWVVGDASLKSETLPEEEVKAKAMAILRKFGGKTMNITEPIGMIRTTWHSNPFVRGAYTYDNLDMPKHPNAREDLAAPLVDSAGQPRILFAGEATNKIHYSTVHGAVETGYREAQRLLAPSRN